MICYALLIPDDSSAGIRRLRAFHAETGELELEPLLYVLHQKNYLKWDELPARPMFP